MSLSIALPEAAIRGASASPARRAWRRLLRRRGAMVGLAVVLGFVVLAFLAPWLASHDPVATDWGALRKAPSLAHWFGTDELGRDVYSRVVFGTRASLLAGVVSVSISLAFGVPIGMLAASAFETRSSMNALSFVFVSGRSAFHCLQNSRSPG